MNKRPWLNIFPKIEGDILVKKAGFDKISSLDSLKNGNTGLKIKKVAIKPLFSSSATGTHANILNRQLTSPAAARKLQPALCYQQAVYRE